MLALPGLYEVVHVLSTDLKLTFEGLHGLVSIDRDLLRHLFLLNLLVDFFAEFIVFLKKFSLIGS